MILLNGLDNFAAHKGFFSEMQFGFQEGVGCTEALFTILETIKGAVGSTDLKISKSALLSLNHHNFSNTKPIYTE